MMSEYKYTFNKKVNRKLLKAELEANMSFTAAVYDVTVEGDSKEIVNVYTKTSLDGVLLSLLGSIVANHVYVDIAAPIDKPKLMTLIENERCLEEGIELTYRMYPKVFDIPEGDNGGQPYTFDILFPCTVAMLGATVDLNQFMLNDMISFDVPSTTIIGFLAEGVDTTTNICKMDPDAKAYIYKGMDIIINGESQGRITGYDDNGDYILHENFKSSFPINTPVAVRFKVVDPYLVTTAPLTLWVSRDTDRATIVPKNTPMQFIYWNHSGIAKKVQLCFELYT